MEEWGDRQTVGCSDRKSDCSVILRRGDSDEVGRLAVVFNGQYRVASAQ